MPKLSALQEHGFVKMLLIGDSGNGKTGALAALALAGYKVRIIDFDKGIEPVKEAIIKSGNLAALQNVDYQQLDDQFMVVAGQVLAKGVPTSVQAAMKLLDYWGPKSVPGADDLGKPSEWGRDCVIVIDSLTHLCNCIMRYVQATNPAGSTSGKNPSQPEWGSAQRIVEQILSLLYSADFKTNVIVTAHVTYIQGEETLDDKGDPAGQVKGFPSALGRALPPKIPSYFNHMLVVDKRGMGAHTKRIISTVPSSSVNAKSPLILSGIPAELPIETGLATYFDAALGKKGAVAVPPVSVTTPVGAVPAVATIKK